MYEEVLTYLTILALAMLKFAAAPIAGATQGIPMVVSMLIAVAGMMLTVTILAYGGPKVRNWLLNTFAKKRKKFTKRNRQFVRIWRRWGMPGVAFLTPLIFSPIIGTMLAVAVGAKRSRIMLHMFISAVFWSVVQTILWYEFKDVLAPYF